MKKVGYLEGTDSIYLTRLSAIGVDTLPLGNGADNHGKYIGFIDKSDSLNLIISYFHKIATLTDQGTKPDDLLKACALNKIPVLVIAPNELQDNVRQYLEEVTAEVHLVDPADVMVQVKELLSI
jgi:hypothetical protein